MSHQHDPFPPNTQTMNAMQQGDPGLLSEPKVGILCSRACPGSIIIEMLDMVRAFSEYKWTIVSGFQ